MKNTILVIVALLISQNIAAQMMPRKVCGTAMMIERENAKNGLSTRAIAKTPKYVKHTGDVTVPAILVNFSDVKFTINRPKVAFEQMFNGTTQQDLGNGNEHNHGSVAQYFKDMSGNTFRPTFKVYGPVTVDHPETYYGGKNNDDNNDENPRQLVKDALALIKDSVSAEDISAFSPDGSTIESVYILYAGLDQNDNGPATAVWANTFSTGDATLAGKKVRWYTMSGELSPYRMTTNGKIDYKGSLGGTIPIVTGLGVACHEFCHSLGLPDIYSLNKEAQQTNNQSMEFWDLMDGGEYAGYGFYPTALTAFEKDQLGWPVTIKELSSNASITMDTSTEKGGTAYKIVNPNNHLEYLMLECIQQREWNRHQYGNGLLVYHVNLPSEELSLKTRLNDYAGFPGMAVVPADGACLSSYITENKGSYSPSLKGDLFPGTGNMTPDTLNVSELSDANSKPNFCWYDINKTQKLKTNKALRNIRYVTATGVITFDYINDVASGIQSLWKVRGNDGKVYSLDGHYLGNDLKSLPHGIYIKNGQKIAK